MRAAGRQAVRRGGVRRGGARAVSAADRWRVRNHPACALARRDACAPRMVK